MRNTLTFKAVLFSATLFVGMNNFRSQCSFSGLGPDYCPNAANVTLTPVNPGGYFSGAGMVGSVFTPSLAGAGTVSVTYAFCSTNYSVLPGTYAPLPVTGATTLGVNDFPSSADDGTSAQLPIGFSFQFFCNTYTDFYIATNGYITFTGGQANPYLAAAFPIAPEPVNCIALPWTDLNLNFGGNITYATVGTIPNRKLVVTYNGVAHHNLNTGGYPVTAQAILYEGTNLIEIHTTSMPIPNNPYNATMGINNANGSIGFAVPGRNGTGNWSAINDMYQFIPETTCSETQTTLVSPANVPIAGSASLCTGQTTTLTAGGNNTYTWTTSSGSVFTDTIVLSPTANTTYTVEGINSYGCVAKTVKTVTVNLSPVVTATSSASSGSICLGNTLTLNGGGVTSYTWTNSGVTNGMAFSPNATAIYTVVGGNACGTASTTISVTVNPLPVTAATTSTLVCSATAATLTAGGATSYTWMPGNSNSINYIVTPASNTNYTVTGKTGVCIYTAAVSVSTKTLPVMSIASSGTLICEGTPVNLTVNGDATTYSWSTGGTGNSISVSPNNTTVYTVTGTNVVNCSRSVSQVIAVNQNPIVNVSTTGAAVCVGGSATLSATGASSLTWDASGANTSTFVVFPTGADTYSVTGTNTITGCHATAFVNVSVFDPQITVSSNTAICLGSSAVLSANDALSYLWVNNNSTGQSISVAPTVNTTYTVVGQVDQDGLVCPAEGTIDVTVNALPVIAASADPLTICSGKSASLTASGAGATGTYTWTGGLGNNDAISVSPIVNQTYIVSGTDANGCRSTGTVQVMVSPCTGINSIAATTANLLIYPNPSTGEFTISADQAITLNIVNELGQQVKVISLNQANPAVKVSNLATGVYFIMGANENGSVTQKIVIAN